MHSQNTLINFSPYDGVVWKHRPPVSGKEYREHNPLTRWNFNPWTGAPRNQLDVAGDSLGELIVPPGEDLRAQSVADTKLDLSNYRLGQTTPVAPYYQIVITHGKEKHTLISTEKSMLGHLCAEVFRGMK